MRPILRRTVPLLPALAFAVAAGAQTPANPNGRPNVLMIVREQVKLGKDAAHEANESGFSRLFRQEKVPIYFTGATSMTGAKEAWFMFAFQSMADMEAGMGQVYGNPKLGPAMQRLDAADAEYVNDVRVIVATLRPDLSYGTPTLANDRRVWRMTTYRVKPGGAADFERHRRLIRDASEKAGAPIPFAVFQVNSGMPGPAFLVVQARRELAAWDDTTGLPTYRAALGEAGRDELAKIAKDVFVSQESNYFVTNPRMSHAAPEVVAMDPGYWRPAAAAAKPEMARKAPAP